MDFHQKAALFHAVTSTLHSDFAVILTIVERSYECYKSFQFHPSLQVVIRRSAGANSAITQKALTIPGYTSKR